MTPPLTTTLDELEGRYTVAGGEWVSDDSGQVFIGVGELRALIAAARAAPPTEALRLLAAIVRWTPDASNPTFRDLIKQARRYLAATEVGTDG